MFGAPSPVNPNFAFGSLAGRYVVLAFLPEPGPERDAAIQAVRDQAALFDTNSRVFFGVLPDTGSFAAAQNVPPLHWFFDPAGDLRKAFDAVGPDGTLAPQWFLLDPMLRVVTSAPLDKGPQFLAYLAALGPPEAHAGVPMHAPVLIVPRIFELEMCRRLIDLYASTGGTASGVMRQRDGKTIGVLDDFKKRKDAHITDPGLIDSLRARLARRLAPEIEKVFQFRPTRIERYIVACYDAEDGGYFKAHRDNTTMGTAHRRFAVSINLNAEDFEGGDLRFPEFGHRTYRPPTGGAVVFSCSLLHEATPVTRGTRYAFLPFLFDEDAEKIRLANRHALVPDDAEANSVEDDRAPETAA
jgi:predicted 2-oxoglutarate/Fe(II)-dependent dioxygenase YbiX